MDVLAEDGELLGQITIALVKLIEAVAGTNAPFRPMMERVRAATADPDVVALAMLAQGVAQATEVGGNAVDGRPRQGADFDHAFGDFQLDLAETFVVIEAAEQVGGAPRQVEIALRDQLQFEFDAQGKSGAVLEVAQCFGRHAIPPRLRSPLSHSPDLCSASRHRAGPTSSIMAAANRGKVRAERPTSGYKLAIS